MAISLHNIRDLQVRKMHTSHTCMYLYAHKDSPQFIRAYNTYVALSSGNTLSWHFVMFSTYSGGIWTACTRKLQFAHSARWHKGYVYTVPVQIKQTVACSYAYTTEMLHI